MRGSVCCIKDGVEFLCNFIANMDLADDQHPQSLMLKLEADVENWEEFRVREPRQLKDLEARQNVTHMKAQRCHQRIWSEEQSWENTAAARGACSSPWRHAVN